MRASRLRSGLPCIRYLAAHGCVGVEDDFFLAIVCAARDPHRSIGNVIPPERRTLDTRVVWHVEVELDVPGDVSTFRAGADRSESLGVGLRLCRNDDSVRQRFAEQPHHPPVPGQRAWGYPGTGEDQRNSAAPALVIQIRPQLCFEDDGNLRADPRQEASDGTWQVIRQIDVPHFRTEQAQDLSLLRGRHAG